jgi:hypothetical protein
LKPDWHNESGQKNRLLFSFLIIVMARFQIGPERGPAAAAASPARMSPDHFKTS